MFKLFQMALLSLLIAGNISAASTDQGSKKAAPMLVISCSLNTTSNGANLAKYAFEHLKSQGQDVELVDLRDYKLPMANGHGQSAYDDPQVKVLHDKILKAGAILIVAPIYNNNVAAVAKNLVELTTHAHKDVLSGKAWRGKVVGFMGTAGGRGATWSFFPFINGLMVDSKIVFVPSFVLATGEDFNASGQVTDEIKNKVDMLDMEMIRLSSALGAK
ncbi:MAG: NAD(P)H-dependent oxidoreductase [Alphaproteobacteria bacterium]|nr:NAD(P)H-dependent oxidoreductase [Alphaproteobacteria bacterium]